jgi:hypothetical protein
MMKAPSKSSLFIFEPSVAPLSYVSNLYDWKLDQQFKFLPYDAVGIAEDYRYCTILCCGTDKLSQTEAIGITSKLESCLGESSRILNHPLKTLSRFCQLKALHETKINKYSVWKVSENHEKFKFPLFLRDLHSGRIISNIINSIDALHSELNNLPLTHFDDIMAVQWHAEIFPDGAYRKYSAFIVGNNVIPAHMYLSTNWCIRSKNKLNSDRANKDEQIFLNENPHKNKLLEAARVCNIDYARVDYSVISGIVQIYEFNLNPFVASEKNEKNRTVSKKLFSALNSLRHHLSRGMNS